jgi:hypothetical protein
MIFYEALSVAKWPGAVMPEFCEKWLSRRIDGDFSVYNS